MVGRIKAFEISECCGGLSQIHNEHTGSFIPRDITVHPSGRFAFAVGADPDGSDPEVRAFFIQENGNGDLSSYQTESTGDGPVSVRTDPLGHVLLVSNAGDGTISVFTINHLTGELTEREDSPVSVDASLVEGPFDALVGGTFAFASFNAADDAGRVLGVEFDPNTGQVGADVADIDSGGQFPLSLVGSVKVE